MFIRQVEVVAEPTSTALRLSKAQAREVVNTMGVLLIGATQADQGPSLNNEELPEDVQGLIAGFSPVSKVEMTLNLSTCGGDQKMPKLSSQLRKWPQSQSKLKMTERILTWIQSSPNSQKRLVLQMCDT